MPTPSKNFFAKYAKTAFISNMIMLPVEWEDMGELYQDAFDSSELRVPPNPSSTLFIQATLNKYHVDTAKDISDQFEAFIDKICEAICHAIDLWMKMAKFTSVRVMAMCAIGAQGCLSGPGLKMFILSKAPQSTAQEKKYSDAIATAFENAWKAWQDNLMIPGLPWYPAFAAFPGPHSPPVPNIPFPLIALPSAGEDQLLPASLHCAMENALGDSEALHASNLFKSLALAFALVFFQFKISTIVSNLMGMGPIPTFAPPFAPVGPVVAGNVLPIPGVIK